MRSLGSPVSAKSIKLKSKEIALDLNVTGFKASDGWFRRFLRRSNYCFRRVSSTGRGLSKNAGKTCEDFINKCSETLLLEPKKSIFNMDETSIYLDSPGNSISSLFLIICFSSKF